MPTNKFGYGNSQVQQSGKTQVLNRCPVSEVDSRAFEGFWQWASHSLYRYLRPLALIGLVLATFPLQLIAGLYSYALRARIELGYWPSYGRPDPKQLGWWIHHDALGIAALSVPVIAVVTIVFLAFGRVEDRQLPVWTLLVAAALSIVALCLYCWGDPHGLVDWYLDF